MAQPALLQAMQRQPAFQRLLHRLPDPGVERTVGGLTGSSPALLVAALADAQPGRLWVAVASDPGAAEAFEADLDALGHADRVQLYPQREALPYEAEDHHLEVSGLRVEALEALLSGRTRVLVTPRRALQELAEIPDRLAQLRLTVAVGDAIRPHDLADRVEKLGFRRVPLVEGVGEYAMRGGIVDLFGFGAPEPIRIEFWGDEITSIRRFDILDQRSTAEVDRVDVLPVDFRAAAGARHAETASTSRRSLLDILPGDAVLVDLATAEDADRTFGRTWDELVRMHDAEHKRGRDPAAPHSLFLPPDTARERLTRFGRLSATAPTDADVRFRARSAERVDRDTERLAALLRTGAARGEDTLLLCDNRGQLERLEELLGGPDDLPDRATIALGTVSEGFVLEGADPPVRVLTDHEIFRRARRLRRRRRFRGAVSLESLAQLKPGDYVVHLDHGVGRFQGLEHVHVGGEEVESLAIEYAGGEILRVPVYRLDLIERWVPGGDGEGKAPRIHKIGGKSWKKTRRKTERAIREMATELLELYAARHVADGHAASPDTRWQKEMEAAFLYEDTPDQRKATADVKRDMESPRPMDRLLCGDVGYGKTEVAVRAAFKMVQDGKQVAVLAPTTILVEQHLRTFRERLADFPVRVAGLSRLRTRKEQERALAGVADGSVDIVVGTHRLLGDDIVFHELGLLVIDEEQRFGVRHKERLKSLKRNIDVLAMTATPIPRTMHLSLAGLRDLSLIRTPPRDRMPVITHVLPWVDEVLEDAIRRELDRGGQVFFVHNRVQTIESAARRVRSLVPDADVAVAHGQLRSRELDDVMRRFLERDVQVLVTTTIIENGLDVPNANTLIVDRADRFGLAQLYQLRGRVGRSHHRAYCYLVVPEHATYEAEKRLRILEHHTELGSGYAIALKDLELRGAGNLLGQDQSGYVHAVGLETYTRLLEDTIRRMRAGDDGGERSHEPPDVSLQGAAYLPDEYVPEPSQKLHLYRRLSRLDAPESVDTLRAELRDRFGPTPPEVDRVLDGALLRLLGARLGIERILLGDDEARVNFREGVVPRLARLQNAFHERQLDVEVRRTTPLSLVIRRYGAEPLARTLADAMKLLAEDDESDTDDTSTDDDATDARRHRHDESARHAGASRR